MAPEYTTVDRIIAKIDNDFNPNNSDWIPRVGAWVHDALMQLDCFVTEEVKKKLTVKDRIARSDCELGENIKLYDSNGCEIKELDDNNTGSCCNGNKTSISSKGVCQITPDTVAKEIDSNKHEVEAIAFHENVSVPYPPRYNVVHYKNSYSHGYVRINHNLA